MPLTNFRVLRMLKDEFSNLEEIYTIFSSLQDRTREIESLKCSIFFDQPNKYGLDEISVRVDGLKVRFGDHTVLKKLEKRMESFRTYQTLLLR